MILGDLDFFLILAQKAPRVFSRITEIYFPSIIVHVPLKMEMIREGSRLEIGMISWTADFRRRVPIVEKKEATMYMSILKSIEGISELIRKGILRRETESFILTVLGRREEGFRITLERRESRGFLFYNDSWIGILERNDIKNRNVLYLIGPLDIMRNHREVLSTLERGGEVISEIPKPETLWVLTRLEKTWSEIRERGFIRF